jgi:CheY-like chemotaxis protein
MGQSRVLLVDDDKALLKTFTETLRAEGYFAQPAISGDVALVLLQQGVPFELLITDIVLPGLLDGFALARHARDLCPGIPIIYSTGFMPVAHIRGPGAPYGELLVKPWKVDAMLTAAATALGARCRVEFA